jgi:hypothetical protein
MGLNFAGGVYGTIAVAALLAAESARRETYPATVAAVAVTMILYWIAHSYADFTGERLEKAEKLTLAGLARAMINDISIIAGAAVPLIVLLLWWASGAQLTSAVDAAIWTSAGIIALTELIAGVHAELSGRELLGQASVGAVLGGLVILLRVLLH